MKTAGLAQKTTKLGGRYWTVRWQKRMGTRIFLAPCLSLEPYIIISPRRAAWRLIFALGTWVWCLESFTAPRSYNLAEEVRLATKALLNRRSNEEASKLPATVETQPWLQNLLQAGGARTYYGLVMVKDACSR